MDSIRSLFGPATLAKGAVPTSSQSRKLLYSKDLGAEQAVEIGLTLKAAGRYSEALLFFEKSGKLEEIGGLASQAIEIGDLFLYEAACRARIQDLREDELRRLAERALAEGKLHFARRAFELAGLPEKSQEAAAQLSALTGPPQTEVAPAASGAPEDMDEDD